MKKLLLAGMMMILGACTNTPQNMVITELDKLKHEGIVNMDGQLSPALYEFALVDHVPEDSLGYRLRLYAEAKTNKAEIAGKYARYFIQFYKRSAGTESYVNGKEDFWDEHNNIMQENDDYLGEYRYERCKTDTTQGTWTMEVVEHGQPQLTTLESSCEQ